MYIIKQFFKVLFRVRIIGQILKDVSIKCNGEEIIRIIFVIIKKHYISILSIINRNLTIATVLVRFIHVGLGVYKSLALTQTLHHSLA